MHKLFYALILSISLIPCAQGADWIIVPGKRVGGISGKTSEANLKKIYGATNVVDQDIGIGEGETEPGSVLFPTDPIKRIEIFWSHTTPEGSVKRIVIDGEKSIWKTDTGISSGTSLHEIEKINLGPFELAGFDTDYGGIVHSFLKGKLSEYENSLGLQLGPPNSLPPSVTNDEYNSVCGDALRHSDNPVMQKLNPSVREISIVFEKQ